jgi:hypothetical protein
LGGFFLGGGFVCFCWGFYENRVFECGFWVVSLWWNRGELWSVDGHFLGAKNLPQILNLFFWDSRFGIRVDRDERSKSHLHRRRSHASPRRKLACILRDDFL